MTAREHMPGRLGRFELRRVLGQGAQATVWLGFDPRLEREVAVKLMRPAAESAADDESVTQWLQEARSVSRLNHPNIVPVFEADVEDGQPYLVFEFVDGRTLSEVIRGREAPLPARDAVMMMIGVLDALTAAHGAGVVHRDLKPSNILVDAGGRARVMDFGIAARIAARGGDGTARQHRVVGTPGYMSPEAARGEAPAPAMDIFAVGLMLAEMLCGRGLIAERDPYRAIHRAANEDIQLPAMPPEVDDRLRALLMRSIARQAAQRMPSAAQLRDALQEWLTPPVATGGNGGSGVLDFLLRRMKHKSDFPALSNSVARIQRVASSDKESLGSLSAEILKDVALTNKLLRMVNTAHYALAGGGSISTVSRAVALVGFAGIRNMALSLVLLEHMQDKLHAAHLKEEFLRALMAGSMASQLSSTALESEESFIGALFQNLGRLLTKFYFPEEARQVEQAMAQRSGAPSEEAASLQVLGMSYEDLGLGVARSWGLPDSLLRCMRTPQGDPPGAPPARAADRLRWVTAAANDVATALLHAEPSQADARVSEVADRYARVLGISAKEMREGAHQAREHLREMAQAMGLVMPPGAAAQRLLAPPPAQETMLDDAPPAPAPSMDLALPLDALPAIAVVPSREQASSIMTAGIQDITNAIAENVKLNDVLHMVLETMWQALGFRRVLFCLRDAKTDVVSARFGLGDGIDAVLPWFKVPLKGGSDLFAAVCRKAVDTLIIDAAVPHIAARLPGWFTQHVDAPAFLLLPLQIKGAPFALIYADKALAGTIDIGEKELSLLRTLRNQAVMAFRQTG